MRILDYLAYRVFEYFSRKNTQLARVNTINFMILFEVSLMIPLFFILNGIFHFFNTPENPDPKIKYYIGITLAVLLGFANNWYFKRKLGNAAQSELYARFSEKGKNIPIWLIFISPIIFVFVTPIIYGYMNGTLSFPFFEQ